VALFWPAISNLLGRVFSRRSPAWFFTPRPAGGWTCPSPWN